MNARARTEHRTPAKKAAATMPPWRAWLPLAVVLLSALVLYSWRLGDPLGGFHATNEGFYLDQARRYLDVGVLGPWLSPLDANNPPLYAAILSAVFSVVGPSMLAARWLSVLSALAVITLTWELGRTLYNDRVALVGATATAFAPGMLLVGRNIQTDAMMVALSLGATLLYVRSVRAESAKLAVSAGLVLAVATLVKLPAVLVIPALALWRLWWDRGFGWLRERGTWMFAGGFGALAVLYYVVRLAGQPAFGTAQGRILGLGGLPAPQDLLGVLLNEPFWMMSPVVSVAIVAAVGFMGWKRQPADKLVLSMVAVHAAFYVVYNIHVYYLLPLVPWMGLAVGRGVVALLGRSWKRSVVAAACVALLAGTVAVSLLGEKKLGAWSPAYFESEIERVGFDPAATDLLIWGAVDVAGPAFEWYRDQPQPTVVSETPMPAGTRPALLLGGAAPTGATELTLLRSLDERPVRLVLFGHAVRYERFNHHYFAPGPVEFDRVGPLWRFGLDDSAVPSWWYRLYLVDRGGSSQ